MGVWLVWLILAVVLGVAEILTLTAVLGILSAAALITSIAACGCRELCQVAEQHLPRTNP
jgi:membrane protein implicated in regulation of membrane protease activity